MMRSSLGAVGRRGARACGGVARPRLAALGCLLVVVAASVASTPWSFSIAGRPRAADRVDVAGTFSASDKISVANLTVAPHEYDIAITFDARLTSVGVPTSLRCGVIDNNGFRRFFLRDQNPVRAFAGWEHHTITARVALPDVTLGLRCVAEREALISASFRAIHFVAVEVDHREQGDFGAEGFGRTTFG